MFSRIRNYFRDYAAALFYFGPVLSEKDLAGVVLGVHVEPEGRLFPSYLVLGWRDENGLRLTVTFRVMQWGLPDPHLMPFGARIVEDRVGSYRFAD